MPAPNNTADFLQGIELIRQPDGQHIPSQALLRLLSAARSGYDWPAGIGANISQQTILNLEDSVAGHLDALNPDSAYSIVVSVSYWAGNNTNSRAAIIASTNENKAVTEDAVASLCEPGHETHVIIWRLLGLAILRL